VRHTARIDFPEEGGPVGRNDPDDPRERFEAYALPCLDVLYRAAVRLTGDSADAEDLVQEMCLRAFAAIGQLADVGSCKAWLFRILRTTYLRRWGEDPHRRHVVNFADLESALADLQEVAYDHYENDPGYVRLVGADIRRAIVALPLPYREAIVLAHVAGFSYRDMARILDIPLGTVMSRLYRGRRMLRASLREYARAQRPLPEVL
jgi:RNA polymerase sigma-70 factor (ECF subfamily)